MRHARCRRLVSEGSVTPEVSRHLEACEPCRAFAHDLARLGELARAMAPGPAPAGLADRVLAHVDAAAGEAAPVIALTEARRRRRPSPGARANPPLATMAIAAALVLLVGVLAVLGRGGGVPGQDRALDPLLTAADHVIAAGSARVALTGHATMSVTIPEGAVPPTPQVDIQKPPELPPFAEPPRPDFSGLPPEARQQAEQAWAQQVAEARRTYEQRRAEWEQSFRRLHDDARRAFEEARRAMPAQLSFDARIEGTGEVVFPDRLHVRGSIDITHATAPIPSQSNIFEVVTVGTKSDFRGPDLQWIEVPGPSGPLGPMVLAPDGVRDLLAAAQGTPQGGDEETLDGERVRHYRFRIGAGAFGTVPGTISSSGDAFIAVSDGVLRRLTVRTESSFGTPGALTGRLTSETTLRLYDLGAKVSVEAPARSEVRGRASSPLGAGAILYPYQPGFPVSFSYGLTPPGAPAPAAPAPERPPGPPVVPTAIPAPPVVSFPPPPTVPPPSPPTTQPGPPGAP